jgi:hypothetical protein
LLKLTIVLERRDMGVYRLWSLNGQLGGRHKFALSGYVTVDGFLRDSVREPWHGHFVPMVQ